MMRLLLLALLLAHPGAACAGGATPLFYTRDMLTIQRAAPPASPGAPVPPPLRFDVEVRDANAYYNQKDWFSLSGPNEDSGVLLVFAQPGRSPIIASGQYAPLDILFIDAQGRITQMLPSIHLSTLAQQIVPQNAVLAFLFLKSGTCQRYAISPGDGVDYAIFHKPPLVLGDPVILVDAAAPGQPAPGAARVSLTSGRKAPPPQAKKESAPQMKQKPPRQAMKTAARAASVPLPLLPPLPPAPQEAPQQTVQEEPQIDLPVVSLPPSPHSQ